jgi:hypothetical protein
MNRVVISQPMYFPWIGIFEQIAHCDTFIHLDDVQFSKGGFVNRVQIKNPSGQQWLTAPIHKHPSSKLIMDVQLDEAQDWRKSHLKSLTQNYAKCPYFNHMMTLASYVLCPSHINLPLCALNQLAIEIISHYLGLRPAFLKASSFNISSTKSQRVIDLVNAVSGTTYITGHGARNYLDHPACEKHGFDVRYIHYQHPPYQQPYPPFIPFVSILDLIASTGPNAHDFINPTSVNWKTFIGS